MHRMISTQTEPPTDAGSHHKRTRDPGYVLVVDDEEANRILLRDPLEAYGYEVKEAETGSQALGSVAKRLPDTILLDVMMPGMDGFQVCRQLKHDRLSAHVPILMITALSDRKERLQGIEAGANDFLNKPVDIQDVILRVGNAVQSKNLFDELQAEREKSERLLLSILPKPIAERMKYGETNIADHYPETSVLVADLVGFTTLASHISADQIVCLLNEIFSSFDLLVEKYSLEKIKTIGDAYMVAGGIPLPRPDHAEAVARLALDMVTVVEKFNCQYDTSIQIRIGINSGAVIAGVIGRKKFAYDLWGDTVNIACRMESSSRAGTIQVSESTYDRLRNKFDFERPHTVDIKGRGKMLAYHLATVPYHSMTTVGQTGNLPHSAP